MSRPAQDILIPPQTDIFRAVFLYVGQGESTLLFIPNNGSHLKMLVDSNQGRNTGGIDLIKMLKDLFDGEDEARLDYFVNTHPHGDHAGDLDAIQDEIEITNVWHSGHDPGPDHNDAYKALGRLRKKAADNGGEDRTLCGSRDKQTLGEAVYYVLSPAQHVQDDISDETPEIRYRRIHEHCTVLKIGYGSPEKFVLITGDSDKCAWQEHITDYHGAGEENRLKSDVLSASHHGSRTFFKTDEKDSDPYTRHMDYIDPQYLVISSPVQAESCHDHPHDDALELYKKYVAEEDILHTGEGKTSFIIDIYPDGQMFIDNDNDNGDLAETYGFSKEDDKDDDSDGSDNNGGNDKRSAGSGPYVVTRIDKRPMGRNE